MQLVSTSLLEDKFQFKRGATYLIAGGLGGLGRHLTSYLTQAYEAKVIVLGRSALSDENKLFLDSCKSAYYYQVDISNQRDLVACFQGIQLTFPQINGVFNLVALSNDDYFIQQNLEVFIRICATKIEGTLNLDQILAKEPLDFFVLFSSIAAILGNRGQSDYTAANAWLYQFAVDRNRYVKNHLRQGLTVSINWPYISGGGFQLDAVYLNWMKEHWGMLPMSSAQCITAIPLALSCGAAQVMPFLGNQEQLINYYNKTCLPNDVSIGEKIQTKPSLNLQQNSAKLEQELKTIIAAHQKIKLDELNIETDLTEYGYNSISFTELSTLINEKFTLSTTPALFFDATCISALSELLIEDYPDVFALDSTNELVEDVQEEHEVAELKGTSHDDPIAIIGYHARFPGAESIEEYWSNLESGLNSITEIPPQRWRWQDVYGNPEEGDFTRSKWGGFIPDLDKFDARFFGISPREAELMDPQQRIFLQSVYHAMEYSGYTRKHFSKQKTGLYVGVSLFEYGKLLQLHAGIDAYTSSGTVHSIVANRVSYILGLTGPSIALDTACSSSLVAIHEAVKALRYGDCELAIAGGVNALIEPSFYIAFDKAGMLSPDGVCKTFDKEANGYVRGEGVASLILKPLSQALRDKDNIYGLVKGTGINHGGHAQTMTSPNPKAQAELIIDTFQKAKVPFNTVQYFECHGTGTPLGDPVEVNGLKKAYQALKQHNIVLENEAPCGIGSVKTNIGHLESSAGVAGILKVLLMMHNKMLVKTINFSQLNPYIDLSNTPFYVVNENKPWLESRTSSGQVVPLRAAVSGFGFGGANAHVILEMPPLSSHQESTKAKPFYLITLSAHSEETLQRKIHELVVWLDKLNNSQHDRIEAISFTLNQGREHFNFKFACVASSQQELLNILNEHLAKNRPALVFMGSHIGQAKANATDLYEQLKICSDDHAYKALLITLAQDYVDGRTIDWTQLHRGEANYRIVLPLYPFEKKAYWFTKKVKNPPSLPELGNTESQLSHYCYIAKWERFLPQLLRAASYTNDATLVVYFDKTVQTRFQSSFPPEVLQFVILDNEKNELGSGYGIDRDDVFSYMDAFSSIGKMEKIYFICPQKSLEDDLSQAYLTSFYRFIKSMLYVHYEQRKITIKVITFGITNLKGEAHQLNAGAGIQGFAKTLANEFLDWQVDQFDFSKDITRLPEEIHHSLNLSGHLCLYRNDEWYRQRLVPHKFEQSLQGSALKKMGTYLIVGGLGGVGKVLADYLTVHYKATVILVGRRTPQEIDENYHSHYLQCDISQEQSVLSLYDNLQKSYPQIDGIFHCAMVLNDQPIRQMSETNLTKVIKPKALGTYHLLTILGDYVRDFIAIFSSTESYFALAGQSNYTAASWLQDQIAEAFYRQQKKIKLIHWGLWEEAGAVSDEHYQKNLYKLGFVGIKNKDALQLLELALSTPDFDVALLGLNPHAKTIYPILNLNSSVESTSNHDPFMLLNEKALLLLWAVFNHFNIWTDSKPIITYQQLLNLTNGSKQSANLLVTFLSFLEKNQFIGYQVSTNSYVSRGHISQPLTQVVQDIQQLMQFYPDLKSFLDALIQTTTHLFDLLQGRVAATELLCPDGSLSLLRNLYFNNAIVNSINALVGKKVEKLVRRQLSSERSIKIIEIGAGCGGTTSTVLELLKDKSESIQYTFTDISPAFINRAREYFSEYTNIEFQVLDVEATSALAGTYDLLIASNVLHTTKDIRQTLSTCKRFLNPNGSLIINEVTEDQPFLTLIFGFFPGWWAFQDSFRMPNSPLLSAQNWRLHLSELDFKEIEITEISPNDPHTLICAINRQDEILSNQYEKTSENPKTNEIKHKKIIEILSMVLKCPANEINQFMSFADLGLDSITGVSFISKINKEFGINLAVNIIFSHKNVVELAEKINAKEKIQTRTEQQLSPLLLFEE